MVKPKSKAKVVLPKKVVKKKVKEEVVVKEKPGKTASKKSKAPVTSPVKKTKRSAQENEKPGTAPSKKRKVSQEVSDESPKETPKTHKKTSNKEKAPGRPPLTEDLESTTPETDEEEEEEVVVKEKPGKSAGKKSNTTPVKKAKRSVQENQKPGPASSKKRKVSQEGSDESPKETPKTHKKTPNKEKARGRPPLTENLESNTNTPEAEDLASQSSVNTAHRRSTNATGSQNSDTDIATGRKFKKNLKRPLNESQMKSVAGLWAISVFKGSDKDTLHVELRFEDNDLKNEVQVGLEREFWQRGLVDLPLASTLRKIKEFWVEVYEEYKEEHYGFELTQLKIVQVSFMDFVCNSEGRIKFVTDVKAISDRFLDLLGKFAESLQE